MLFSVRAWERTTVRALPSSRPGPCLGRPLGRGSGTQAGSFCGSMDKRLCKRIAESLKNEAPGSELPVDFWPINPPFSFTFYAGQLYRREAAGKRLPPSIRCSCFGVPGWRLAAVSFISASLRSTHVPQGFRDQLCRRSQAQLRGRRIDQKMKSLRDSRPAHVPAFCPRLLFLSSESDSGRKSWGQRQWSPNQSARQCREQGHFAEPGSLRRSGTRGPLQGSKNKRRFRPSKWKAVP